MNRRKHFFFNSIFTKFVLAFFFVGFLPLIGLGYLFFAKLPQDLERDMILNNNQLLYFAARSIELKIGEYDQISQLIYQHKSGDEKSVMQLLEEQDFQDLENFLRSAVYSDRHIESAVLMDADLDVHSHFSKNRDTFIPGFSFSVYPKSEKVGADKKKLTALPTHSEEYFFRSENRIISFVRSYLDISKLPAEEDVVAVFSIEVNEDFMDSILESPFRDRDGSVYVIDREGYPILNPDYPESVESLLESIPRLSADPESELHGYVSNRDGFLFYREIGNTDWVLVYEIGHGTVFQLMNEYKRLGFAILVILLTTMCLLAIAFSRQLFQPIKNIMSQMKRVESGDLTSEVTVKTHDEIQQLAAAYNRMIRKLNLHIQNAYVARIKQKETELNAIRTQIRPHYLYNTLEIIRMSALEEDAEVTQDLILALSEQLQYVIGYSKVEVTLQQELEMIRNYFHIIHIRYEQRFSLEVDVPETLYKYCLPKLTIQPLVENAVVHGLKQKTGLGMVRISARINNGDLMISVIDDGAGIAPGRLEEIRRVLDSEAESMVGTDGQSIGLKNVQDRIRLIYGIEYGLELDSRDRAGTLVTLRIPAGIAGEP